MTVTYARATAELLRINLGKPTGGSGLTGVDVLIIALEDSDGASGLGISYSLAGGGAVMLAAGEHLLERFVAGQSVATPQALNRQVAAALNPSGRGFAHLPMAALDVAAWDLHAQRQGAPLGVAMGGAMRAVQTYGSAGFRPTQTPAEAAERAVAYAEQGYKAVKPRLSATRRDVALMAAVRNALPDDVHLMVDVTERCDATTARWLADACAEIGVLFLEEPLPARDVDGFRALAAVSPVPLAAGERLQGLHEAAPFLKEGLLALVQPDLAMMGGLTECLRVTQLAEACNISVAPHFLPALFVHLAAAAPNLAWLEDFPLLEPLFENPVGAGPDGNLAPLDEPGHGIRLSADARRRFKAG